MNSSHGHQMLIAVCMVCGSSSDVTGTRQIQAVKTIERKPHKDPVLTCNAVLAGESREPAFLNVLCSCCVHLFHFKNALCSAELHFKCVVLCVFK